MSQLRANMRTFSTQMQTQTQAQTQSSAQQAWAQVAVNQAVCILVEYVHPRTMVWKR